ncbi:Riboflavin kinase [Candidatus Methanobinarius endosymbioticus]|uniref:Riboflavin kinase n=1 Tax=Candidatus Methanobinarius endosymbioticus TaxID=2006182 RepID=A0A366MB00_9EURY|nr:Riboflavin kinase [Candidatus Methanobinarius endosymbioticus]
MMIIMEIEGKISTGYGKGAYFLGQDFYKSKFNEKLGFTPYPGTLNITVPKNYLDDIKNIKNSHANIIKPKEDFGGVKYIKAKLNDEIIGAIIFPDKTTHYENYLEFIAEENLRKKLKLKDGNKVNLKISV